LPAGQAGGGEWTEGSDTSSTDAREAQLLPFLFSDEPFIIRPPLPDFPEDATQPPAPGWAWKGQPGSQPGSKEGNWVNPKTGESLRPDMDHAPPEPPHWDYRPRQNGPWYRWYPDGRVELKVP
jgi:hypothetical protein